MTIDRQDRDSDHRTDDPHHLDGRWVGHLEATLRRLGRRRIWAPSALVFVGFATVFFASSAPFAIPEVEAACGRPPPDVVFFTSAAGVTDYLDACGPTGREAYRNLQLADLAYPAVVGLFLASSLSAVLGRLAPRRPRAIWLASIPLVASGFDYLENAFAWLALARYPDPAPTDVLFGYASAAKTLTSWVGGILLLGGLVVLVLRRLRRTANPTPGDPSDSQPVVRRSVSA